MKNDLISRRAAIDVFEKELSAKYNRRELAIGFVGVESILRDLPSAQPERKRGRWLNHLGLPLNDFCSVCAKDSPYNKHWDFCPNCGAEMEK